jgi:hypothetical protein
VGAVRGRWREDPGADCDRQGVRLGRDGIFCGGSPVFSRKIGKTGFIKNDMSRNNYTALRQIETSIAFVF